MVLERPGLKSQLSIAYVCDLGKNYSISVSPSFLIYKIKLTGLMITPLNKNVCKG